jgi:hypothetical protein
VAVVGDHELGERAGRDAHDAGAAQLCRYACADLNDVAGELEAGDVLVPGGGEVAVVQRRRPGPDEDLVVAGSGTGWSVRVSGVFSPLT